MKKILKIQKLGPLENTELEFSKFNVLIGPQGTGKSTVLKLLSAINEFTLQFITSEILHDSQKNNLKKLFRETIQNYYLSYLINDDSTSFTYSDEITKLIYNKNEIKIEFNDEIKKEINKFKKIIENVIKKYSLKYSLSNEEQVLNFVNSAVKEVLDTNVYPLFIPAERLVILFSSTKPFALGNMIYPNYLLQYGQKFTKNKDALKNKGFHLKIFNLEYITNKEGAMIKKDGKQYDFLSIASGWQHAIGILLPLYQEEKLNNVFIEEPELSLFPNAQYELIKEIISISNQKKECSFYISTHSPYIVQSISLLSYAGKIYYTNADENKQQKILKIIDTQATHLIKPEEVKAYYLNENKATPILNNEDLFYIDEEELLKISDDIGEKFNELSDLS